MASGIFRLLELMLINSRCGVSVYLFKNQPNFAVIKDRFQPFFQVWVHIILRLLMLNWSPLKIFISSFKEKPKVIDLSYGDFCVGSKLSDHCHNYIACDIVEQLINFTKE